MTVQPRRRSAAQGPVSSPFSCPLSALHLTTRNKRGVRSSSFSFLTIFFLLVSQRHTTSAGGSRARRGGINERKRVFRARTKIKCRRVREGSDEHGRTICSYITLCEALRSIARDFVDVLVRIADEKSRHLCAPTWSPVSATGRSLSAFGSLLKSTSGSLDDCGVVINQA